MENFADRNKWRQINGDMYPAHNLEDSKLLRCQFSITWSIVSMHLNQNSRRLFVEISKLILKCVWKDKGSRIAKFFSKEEQKWTIYTHWFKGVFRS